MYLIIHKCICNVIAVPNLTQYTKSDKYTIKTQTSKLVRNCRNWRLPTPYSQAYCRDGLGPGSGPPPPKRYHQYITKITAKLKLGTNNKNQDSTSVLPWVVSRVYKNKMILWSIHALWYKGSTKDNELMQVRKRTISLKSSSPRSKDDFTEKSLLGIMRSTLSRYDIVVSI